MNLSNKHNTDLLKVIQKLIEIIAFMFFTIIVLILIAIFQPDIKHWFVKTDKELEAEKLANEAIARSQNQQVLNEDLNTFWTAALIEDIKDDSLKNIVLYGKELISHTAKYLGPKGKVLQMSNGMNCQNCHLDAGTKVWGNNYGAVFSTYPKYRARSGKIEDIYKRINDCFERSLNGKPLDSNSKEIQAIKSYIEYIGSLAKKGEKPKGSGIFDLPYMTIPASPEKGKILYIAKCQSCHQPNGEGLLAEDKIEYTYPPLWGKNSYNHGAGLYRLSRLAGYIKYNMPQGATYSEPQLTDEEAWDIAAFINSKPRPSKDLSKDWPKIEEKPVDHPFGPFADTFSQIQHKLGPFQPIKDKLKLLKK